MRSVKRLTKVDGLVVSIDDVKSYISKQNTYKDSDISGFIDQSAVTFEQYTGIDLLTATYEANFSTRLTPGIYRSLGWHEYIDVNGTPSFNLKSNVTEITSFDIIDSDGVVTAVDEYYLDEARGRAIVNPDSTFYHKTPRAMNGVRIRYTAGFGDSADDIPSDIKQVVLEDVRVNYEGRKTLQKESLERAQDIRLKRVYRLADKYKRYYVPQI